jgi:CubicO group peptidase (beta-lactamase class C family)
MTDRARSIGGRQVNRPVETTPLVPLPAQPAGVPWPTHEWPVGPVPAGVELGPLMDAAFDPAGPLAETYAVVVVHRGRLVYERYDGRLPRLEGPGRQVTAGTPLLSWSMAKSMLHAVVGVLVGDGRLEVDGPAAVPLWQVPDDPRGCISLQQLLEMRDGLAFVEDYEDADRSDVIAMLFGAGQPDMAAFAADRDLAAEPGRRFNYSSGTSNIVSGIVARTVGPGQGYRTFLDERLFGPIGMSSAQVTLDGAGTWVASSYVHATARDYAKFGLLYLRDGMWDGTRLLPEGWVDHGRRARSDDPDGEDFHGRHWWTGADPTGRFWAAGHDGQYVDIAPALDLVIVRMGRTPADRVPELRSWRAALAAAFV